MCVFLFHFKFFLAFRAYLLMTPPLLFVILGIKKTVEILEFTPIIQATPTPHGDLLTDTLHSTLLLTASDTQLTVGGSCTPKTVRVRFSVSESASAENSEEKTTKSENRRRSNRCRLWKCNKSVLWFSCSGKLYCLWKSFRTGEFHTDGKLIKN